MIREGNFMRTFVLVGLLAATACWAQESTPNPQQPPSQNEAQTQAPAPAQDPTITVPAGTRIPLALASPVTYKAARPGTAIRATTAFPVTVGTQLAIPAGTYVEGVIDQATRRSRYGPSMQVHFTRLVYSNGYSVAIEAITTQAKATSPAPSSPEAAAMSSETDGIYAFSGQQSPTPPPLPPLPHPGPSVGVVVGAAVGAAAVGILTIVMLGHHNGSNFVLFDTGWQFQMVLQNPLTVDAASAAAAAK
jgi:hypothetical protein